MKVRFLGFREKDKDIVDPWFTIGKEYEVKSKFFENDGVFVISDDGDEDALFDGEYEIVSEAE